MGTRPPSGEVAPQILQENTAPLQGDVATFPPGQQAGFMLFPLATKVLQTTTGKPYTVLPPDSEGPPASNSPAVVSLTAPPSRPEQLVHVKACYVRLSFG